ncbi:alpha/beta fold hydrolase [Stackebrandtia soli]|uniref:alpha/beta hydrolase n=1 Tax=Stackebrandtia soli TaxID=1892856 RepID=UPI0039E821EC
MPEPTEFTVDANGIPVVVRDYGGDGPALMLLHGGGGHMDHWLPVVPYLAEEYRIVTPELRGHGRSGDGPIALDGFLADLEVVRDHLGLNDFAVVGHSLGGMLAAQWASTGSGIAAVVSVDGHRPVQTDAAHYHGLPDEVVAELLAALSAVFDAQASSLADPVPAEIVAMVGDRGFVQRDGEWYSRFSLADATALRHQPWFVDSVPAFGRVKVPTRVLMARQNPPGMPEEFVPLMDAFRAGLRDDLVAARQTNPLLSAMEVDAGHDMVMAEPAAIAAGVSAFLRENGIGGDR